MTFGKFLSKWFEWDQKPPVNPNPNGVTVHTGLAETGRDLQKTAYKPNTLMTCMIQMIRPFYSILSSFYTVSLNRPLSGDSRRVGLWGGVFQLQPYPISHPTQPNEEWIRYSKSVEGLKFAGTDGSELLSDFQLILPEFYNPQQILSRRHGICQDHTMLSASGYSRLSYPGLPLRIAFYPYRPTTTELSQKFT